MTDETERQTTGDEEWEAANTMRERASASRLKLWVLMGASRHLVAAILTGFVFFAFVIGVSELSPPFARQIQSNDVIETLFATMITVIVTGTTLVVTIGQLVLTQENGPLGDQRNRMDRSMEVRTLLGELTESPPSPDPAGLLGDVLDATMRRSDALRASIDRTEHDPLQREIGSFTESVTENAESVRGQLEGAQFGSFDVVFAALNFNYSGKIVRLERIEHEHGERLSERERERFDELKAALSMFAPVREHIKTLYFQWALIDLSRQILYVAVPAVVVSGIMVAVVNAGTFPGSTLGIDHIVLVVGGAFAVTLVPFVLFVSYVIRILTVAKRTLAIEPLILRDTDR